jgi:hypothetical protein
MTTTDIVKRARAVLVALLAVAVPVTAGPAPSWVFAGAVSITALVASTEASDARRGGGGARSRGGGGARHRSGGGGKRHGGGGGGKRHGGGGGKHHGNRHHNNGHDRHHYHGGALAWGVAAGVTAAAVGSIVYSLPSGCTTYVSQGVTYRQCDGVWYAPRYQGSEVVYVVVDAP